MPSRHACSSPLPSPPLPRSYGAALRVAVQAQRFFQVGACHLHLHAVVASGMANAAPPSRRACPECLTVSPHAAAQLQDQLEAQPVRFMETEALAAVRQAQLALAEVRAMFAVRFHIPHCTCNSIAWAVPSHAAWPCHQETQARHAVRCHASPKLPPYRRVHATCHMSWKACSIPCHAMPCHATPCHAMQCPCHAMPCRAMPCPCHVHAMPCHAVNIRRWFMPSLRTLYFCPTRPRRSTQCCSPSRQVERGMGAACGGCGSTSGT